ncbi:MAG: membrane protein insertase YidC [Rhizobiales bacterium]|nr:membrane protein insertase YidC [Hyphomicrobiales bacterium]
MHSDNNRNMFMAIALSMGVLLAWQILYVGPKVREEQRRQEQAELLRQQQQRESGVAPGAVTPGIEAPGAASAPGSETLAPPLAPGLAASPRETAIAATPRVAIDTPGIRGTINLKGARIDDIVLKRYKETTDRESPSVTFFSPAGTPRPYYAEYGWAPAGGEKVAVPGRDTVWTAAGGTLTQNSPITLTWDNGAGLVFRRVISIDENYLFKVRQEVTNTTGAPVALAPYGLISRHGTPAVEGLWILHEGPIGVIGEEGYTYLTYSEVLDERLKTYTGSGGWLGITDKYWAATLIPDQGAKYTARFTGRDASTTQFYQADYLLDPITVAPGQTATSESRLFAGAKRVHLIEGYQESEKIEKFELLIDWGWFYFITKPLFYVIDYLYKLLGNFGVAILAVTVLVKLLFFPLANKSYVSMSKMKNLQPEMVRIQERFKDDKVKQQQAIMELYRKEKVNPMSGCLPVLVQIPVFFALYKVLYISIEMRHAPFFGWIQDLSAKDPTTIFNLFGLLPFGVPDILVIGVWPVIMGITMWLQMQLNPAPADPIQQKIFAWMPLLFTFMLAPFAAGLVIYWTWNNILSVLQQYVIMRRQGVKIELWDNLKGSFSWLKRSGKPADGA